MLRESDRDADQDHALEPAPMPDRERRRDEAAAIEEFRDELPNLALAG